MSTSLKVFKGSSVTSAVRRKRASELARRYRLGDVDAVYRLHQRYAALCGITKCGVEVKLALMREGKERARLRRAQEAREAGVTDSYGNRTDG